MSRRLSSFVLIGILLAASAWAAPPVINNNDPQHFSWNGAQWYPTGYTPGLNAIIGRNSYDVDPSGTYYKAIMRDMANSNGKLMRQVFYYGQPDYEAPAGNCSVGSITRIPLTYYQRTGPGVASDGQPRYDLTKVNQNYIDHFKNFVAEASAKKVVVVVDIFDSWHLNNEVSANNCVGPRGRKFDAYYGDTVAGVLNNINGVNAKNQDSFHPSTSSTLTTSVYFHQRALVRRLVQEIGSFENIIWSVSNEVEHDFKTDLVGTPDYTAWKDLMVEEIRAAETAFGKPTHLIMQAKYPVFPATTPRLGLPDHIKAGGNDNYLVAVPAGVDLVRDMFTARQSWDMPLIADNDGGEPPMDSANGKRRKAWASLTSGGHMTWFGHLMPDINVWNDVKHVNGRKYFGYVSKFVDALNINLDAMVRSDNLINSGLSGWLYARVGDEYIAYMDSTPAPGGCPVSPDRTLNPTCFPEEEKGMWPGVNSYTINNLPNTFTATWFNPRDGKCQPSFTGAGPNATFNLPTANTDWALHIKTGTTIAGVSVPIPGPQFVKTGKSTEFGVCARGVGATTYAWQFKATGSASFVNLTNNGHYSGVNTPTLAITNVQGADDGTYRCLVNVGGTALNSGPATLTVVP